jgi:diadenosine tetraphosphate (Ap4A) HIT family hydrolase
MKAEDCPLCQGDGGRLVARTAALRVILVEDTDYPGYARVVWNRHVAEMSDLREAERAQIMHAVHAVELAFRRVLRPDKVNLASLGNQVPHVHWHVIARFADDAHFPNPIWAARQREPNAERVDRCRALLPTVSESITHALARVI